MTKLYQALNRKAQEELVRNDVVELLRADFEIGGDPKLNCRRRNWSTAEYNAIKKVGFQSG